MTSMRYLIIQKNIVEISKNNSANIRPLSLFIHTSAPVYSRTNVRDLIFQIYFDYFFLKNINERTTNIS